MKTINALAACGLLIALVACTARQPPAAFAVSAMPLPDSPAATSPRLTAGPSGELTLSWLQAGEDTVALRYSRLVAGRWTDAATVVDSELMFVNWADLPSVLVVGSQHLAAHWLVSQDVNSYAYDIAFAESFDDGRNWSPAATPHTDGTDTEHGFVSIYSDNGGTGLLWLDGRNMVNAVSDDPRASGMQLRSLEQVVDELVCDCCQTDVAVSSSGPIAVYRDRTVDEIRDIYVTRRIDGAWQAGVPVADDHWEIAGCPVNGPSIAAAGERVAVAWFTAATEPMVRVAISADNGASFAAPIDVVRGANLGRAALALLDDGELAISWLESSEPAAAVKARRILASGALGPVRHIGTASGLSVPQMARVGADLVFAWTESQPGDAAGIASASVSIDAL